MAANAFIDEELPLSRSNLRFQIRKSFWYGNNQVVIHLHTGMTGRGRLVLRAVNGARAASVRT